MSLIVEVKISMFEQKNTHRYLTSDWTEDPWSEDSETYPMMTGPVNNEWCTHILI